MDPRDAAILASPAVANKGVAPKELIDDLRFFAKRAKEGRAISRSGLEVFINEKYTDCRRGKTLLWNIAKQNGVEPWWRK